MEDILSQMSFDEGVAMPIANEENKKYEAQVSFFLHNPGFLAMTFFERNTYFRPRLYWPAHLLLEWGLPSINLEELSRKSHY